MNKQEKLFDAITHLDEKYITEAQNIPRKKQLSSWKKWTSIAAAAVILVSAGILGINHYFTNSAVDAPNAEAGGSGHGEGTAFMMYDGPVFPLTLQNADQSISAERALHLDFSPHPDEYSGEPTVKDITVTDRYTLTNTSSEDTAITLQYPYTGDLHQAHLPTLTVNGIPQQTTLVSGPYSGGFRGAGDETTTSMNLEPFHSWEEYEKLLKDGSYLKKAFAEYPSLTQPVTVYTFADLADDGTSNAENPTIGVEFTIDPQKSSILTYGFNGGSYDPETGENLRCLDIPREFSPWYGAPCYLAVLGEDIGAYTTQGYANGGCEKGTEINSTSLSVSRSEMTLGEFLRILSKQYYDQLWMGSESFTDKGGMNIAEHISFEMYYGEVCRFFAEHGALGSSPKERYQWGMLDDIINETVTHDRILVLTTDVTIPAGESITVVVEQIKEPSFDFIGENADAGIMGYDMVTQLGSNLSFTEQTASIVNTELIEIVRQNFGFDLSAGITEVTLDSSVPHYYLEIRQGKE